MFVGAKVEHNAKGAVNKDIRREQEAAKRVVTATAARTRRAAQQVCSLTPAFIAVVTGRCVLAAVFTVVLTMLYPPDHCCSR
jgi:hypothetical protein